MSPELPPPSRFSSRPVSHGRRSSLSQRIAIGTALLAVAWGAFAFGAVYAWAYVPLAGGCAVVGLLGMMRGHVPLRRVLLVVIGLATVALVGLLQLVPLPPPLLAAISPGTERFLRTYDIGYVVAIGSAPAAGLAPLARNRPISIAPQNTVRALQLLATLSLFLIGLLRIMSGSAALRAARGIVTIGALLAIVGIVQKAALGDGAFLGMKIYGLWQPENLLTTPFGPFVNKNHFAGWMILAIPLAFGLVMRAFDQRAEDGGGLRQRLLWLADAEGARMLVVAFATFLMLTSLLMTRSRSGLVCLMAMAVAAVLMVVRRRGMGGRALAGAAGCVVMLILAVVWAGSNTAFSRLTAEPESMSLRLNIWRVALAIVRDFPFFGSGLDSFGAATMHYQRSGGLHYQEAHNDYLQILSEGGIVLALAAGFTILAAVSTIASRFRVGADRGDLYWVRVGAALGLAGIALQSAVEFSLQMPGNAALFALVLAIAMYSPSSVDARPMRRFLKRGRLRV